MVQAELIADTLAVHGFHIIDDFLPLADYQSLATLAQQIHQQGLFRSARIGPKEQVNLDNTIRKDEIYWLEEERPEQAIQTYLHAMSTVAKILNQYLFLGLTELEVHFAVYQPGSFYKKHIDQFKTNKTRKVSCVYYLNTDWTNQDGGELILYDLDNTVLQKVVPQRNRFICFNSELPHEVCLTNKVRYSIAGWMKNRALNSATN